MAAEIHRRSDRDRRIADGEGYVGKGVPPRAVIEPDARIVDSIAECRPRKRNLTGGRTSRPPMRYGPSPYLAIRIWARQPQLQSRLSSFDLHQSALERRHAPVAQP